MCDADADVFDVALVTVAYDMGLDEGSCGEDRSDMRNTCGSSGPVTRAACRRGRMPVLGLMVLVECCSSARAFLAAAEAFEQWLAFGIFDAVENVSVNGAHCCATRTSSSISAWLAVRRWSGSSSKSITNECLQSQQRLCIPRFETICPSKTQMLFLQAGSL